MKTRTLDRGPKTDDTRPMRFLFLVLEAARPGAGGARFLLEDVDEVLVGRGTNGTWRSVERGVRRLHIEVPDDAMSSKHVRITVRPGSTLVADAGSKNGTLVNGAPIAGAELAENDIVEAGRTFFLFTTLTTAHAGDVSSIQVGGRLRTLHPVLAKAFAEVATIATTPIPMLVLGETGTGKELVARAVHEMSGRSGAFIAVNCGAIAPDLIESELFGHRKGSFSGAIADRVGLVEASSGGTLFLDELGEIPERVQVALLRVLQEKVVMPVGANMPVPVDLRVVAATNRDITTAIADGLLRDDLIARLAGYELVLPPLRERIADLGLLIATLWARLGGGTRDIDGDAGRAIVRHTWPRNIRELERTLETALALGGPTLLASHLRLDATPPPVVESDARRAELIALLEKHKGNVSAIADELGKKRQQIQKWLRKYGLDAERYR